MSALTQAHMTVEEYLAFDRASDAKHEYQNGAIRLMTGASERHNSIVSNVIVSIGMQLRGRPCKVYPSDMRVRVTASEYRYPDITVVCGTVELEPGAVDVLINPTVVIEVLSASTEEADRGTKVPLFRQLSSVQEILLIAQNRANVEHYVRQSDTDWMLRNYIDLAAELDLASIGCTLRLADVYAQVSWSAPDALANGADTDTPPV